MKIKTDHSEKTYNRCLSCERLEEHGCNGPRTSAMELNRWCEFMRDMKEVKGLTNADVAQKSGISIKRIEQLMALNCDQDIMRETARRIEDAIIGSSNHYPCILAYEESVPNNATKLSETMIELEYTRKTLENIHASHDAELQTVRNEAQQKIDYLLKQVERLRTEVDHQRKFIDKLLDK